MSVGARSGAADPSTAGSVGGGEAATRPDAAGRLLGRLSVLPALLSMAWLLAGLPLLLLGVFRPVLMLVLSVPLAVLLLVLGLRWIPGGSPGALPILRPGHARTPWWAVAGVVAIALAFGIDQMIYHSQFIIVMRDPASYVQYGNWIAHHGSLPIPPDAAAFGRAGHLVSFQSFAYYQVGNTVVPQFMAGLPMVLASAFWVGGVTAAVAVAPVLGACAVLTFGGLAARLIGPRWAPLAALILALSLPEQFTSRSDYSEPLTQILFLGGLCLIVDSLDRDGTAARVIAALGGLALGLTLLVRIDGAADILPVIPYCGLLLLGRRRQALPLLGGLLVGGIYGVVDGVVLSRPYLSSIKAALVPLALIAALVAVATLIVVAVRWERGVPVVRRTWLPNALTGLVVVIVLGFTIRPYVQTVRALSNSSLEGTMARFQQANHLRVDPTRLYYELSMHWVFWYIGVPAVVLATLGAVLLSRRCLAGRATAWVLPLATFGWIIVTELYSPSITPDQPWASRRLVPAVLPGFILLAVWACSWLIGWLRRIDLYGVLYAGLATVLVALLLVPAAITTFGLRPRAGGPVGIRLAAEGLAFKSTYQGEIAAIEGMCAAIPRGASVVIISQSTADRLTQIVRGMCGNPAARINDARYAKVQKVLHDIVQTGRRPVLLASKRSALLRYGGQTRQIMRLITTIDSSTLTRPPLNNWSYRLNVWMSEPSS
jgi:hypothetical protein